MQLIPGDAETILSADSVDDSQTAMYPTKILNTISPNGVPHRVILKKFSCITLPKQCDHVSLSSSDNLFLELIRVSERYD